MSLFVAPELFEEIIIYYNYTVMCNEVQQKTKHVVQKNIFAYWGNMDFLYLRHITPTERKFTTKNENFEISFTT